MEHNENERSVDEEIAWAAHKWKKAVMHNNPYAPRTSPSEVKALMALFRSSRGPDWFANLNWGCGDPCVEMWWGVQCEYDPLLHALTVTHLHLQSNGLYGTFPMDGDFLLHCAMFCSI